MAIYGRIGSNGEGNSDKRLTGVVNCYGDVPSMYWRNDGTENEPILVNDFVVMDDEKPSDGREYEVVDDGDGTGTWNPTTDFSAVNIKKAKDKQDEAIKMLLENDKRKAYGLPPTMTIDEEVYYQNYINDLQHDIDNPTGVSIVEPPEPPAQNPPDTENLYVVFNRSPSAGGGMEMGWIVWITSFTAGVDPSLLSVAEMQSKCKSVDDNQVFFTYNNTYARWEAQCPNTKEPGLVKLDIGVLDANGNSIKCFHVDADVYEASGSIYIIEE